MTSELRTVYVERETAAALAADAQRRGLHLAELYRERFPDIALPFRIRVIDADDRMRELMAQGLPWREVLEQAFREAE